MTLCLLVTLGLVGLVPGDLLVDGAGEGLERDAVVQYLEVGGLHDDRDDLAGVIKTDPELLSGDLHRTA